MIHFALRNLAIRHTLSLYLSIAFVEQLIRLFARRVTAANGETKLPLEPTIINLDNKARLDE